MVKIHAHLAAADSLSNSSLVTHFSPNDPKSTTEPGSSILCVSTGHHIGLSQSRTSARESVGQYGTSPSKSVP
eukprot:2659283-Rhodomonas_salina.1